MVPALSRRERGVSCPPGLRRGLNGAANEHHRQRIEADERRRQGRHRDQAEQGVLAAFGTSLIRACTMIAITTGLTPRRTPVIAGKLPYTA